MKAEMPVGAMQGQPVAASTIGSGSWTALGCLLLAVAIVHHPVLWIDHVLWDEISFEKMAAIGDLSGKITSLADQGLGAAYPFYAVFAHIPEPTRMLRLCSFLSIWVLAVVFYRILRFQARLPIGVAQQSDSRHRRPCTRGRRRADLDFRVRCDPALSC